MQKCSETLSSLEWPAAGLEHLGRCPACDSGHRAQLFTSLTDTTFGVAPGVWTMWRCEECAVVYLDPRPNEQSIGRAYAHYYTQEPLDDSHCASLFANLTFKTRLRLGYFNSRYGYSFAGGLGIGRMLVAMKRIERTWADYMIRHSPRPASPMPPCSMSAAATALFFWLRKGSDLILPGLNLTTMRPRTRGWPAST